MSDEKMFQPEEGEVFFAEVPNKGIDRKVKAILHKGANQCENCVFFKEEMSSLCWKVFCSKPNGIEQLTFRRVRDGKI